jgi:hypothetical protein
MNTAKLTVGLGGPRPPSGGVAGAGPRWGGSAQRSARSGGRAPLLNALVAEKIRGMKDGWVSVIKQDGRVMQIDVCERFAGRWGRA